MKWKKKSFRVELESTEGSFAPITGEAGCREQKKDLLTVLIDKINDRYGTNFTEMDKVRVQMENDYASQEKWQNYAENKDFKTFMILFAREFPNMAAKRYEQNDDFFVRLFSDPDMMQQVMDTLGNVLYERLKKKKGHKNKPVLYDMSQGTETLRVAEDSASYGKNNDEKDD